MAAPNLFHVDERLIEGQVTIDRETGRWVLDCKGTGRTYA